MKLHFFAITTCLSIGMLSGCAHLANSTDSPTMTAPSTQSLNTSKSKKHHLSGGSNASLEIPFNSTRGPRNTTVDPVATNTTPTDQGKNKSRRVSETD